MVPNVTMLNHFCLSRQVQETHAWFIIVFSILHLLLVLCHAEIFQLPLKQYKRTISTSVITSHLSNNDSVRIYKQRTSSTDKINLDSMKDNLSGFSGDGYYIDVNIGTPPQKLQVVIDTGSANFAIACYPDANLSIFFQRQNSSTYEEEGTEVYVPYTEGEWTGILATDVVALTSLSSLSTKANIACITNSHDFFLPQADWQGILGFAYSQLAKPDSSITPFWDSMLETYTNLDDVFSIQLCGSSFIHTKEEPVIKGSLILGGFLPTLAESDFFYTPLYEEWYYEVIIADIQVDGESLNVDCKEYNMDKTIVDSGTTTIRLPVKIFQAITYSIEKAIKEWNKLSSPGAAFYSGVDMLCFDDMSFPFQIFPVISFFLMETENSSFQLDLTPQHYLRPVVNESEDGEVTQFCVKFGFSSSTTGTVLGAVLMEAFYIVFDRANSRLGFAQTSCPSPDPIHKILNTTIRGPFASNSDLTKCAFKKPESGDSIFHAISYALLAISLVICIPLVLFCVFHLRKVCHHHWVHHVNEDTSETQAVFSTSAMD